MADVIAEARATTGGAGNTLYEMDYDGRITKADVTVVVQQLGRRCSR